MNQAALSAARQLRFQTRFVIANPSRQILSAAWIFNGMRLFSVSAAVFVSVIVVVGCGPSKGWDTKGTLNERIASERVGGFTRDDATLYHRGLQHLLNKHQSVGSLTIAQVVNQERGRETQRADAAAAASSRAEQARQLAQQRRDEAEQRREEAARNHDYCADALAQEKIAASEGVGKRTAYRASVAGLSANERCDNVTAQLIHKGYLLSMKAFAEHDLGVGDWETDMNEANALLVECQTTPGIYGTHTGAACETQESNNIHATTDWQMNQ